MSTRLVEQYVMETKVHGYGIATHTIYSTREGMQALAEALSEGLQRASQPEALWRGQVTTAYTSIYGGCTLIFRLSEDLTRFKAPHHFYGWVKLACWLVFIVFAAFGVEAVFTGFIYVSPYVRGVLLAMPLLGVAVGLLWLRDALARSRKI